MKDVIAHIIEAADLLDERGLHEEASLLTDTAVRLSAKCSCGCDPEKCDCKPDCSCGCNKSD